MHVSPMSVSNCTEIGDMASGCVPVRYEHGSYPVCIDQAPECKR